jgi:hypothetical protein
MSEDFVSSEDSGDSQVAYKKRRSPSRYVIHKGGIPSQVIDYLISYGAGVEKASSVICKDLDISGRALYNSTKTAIRHGVLVKRLEDGENFWSVRSSPPKGL